MDHKFQIDLRGIIDLLSHHLYSGPEVFVRELLQNATDAIRARQMVEPGHAGDVTIEVHAPKGKPPSVVVRENGIGLTTEQVHKFLATIGLSSKRAAEGERPTDFIGQFGIGILSCFVVSDSITVYSKSATENSKAVEWKAKPDGTYTVRELERDLPAGTEVWLTAKEGCEEHFEAERVTELAKNYGGLLPFPVRVVAGKTDTVVNANGAPWRRKYKSEAARTKALLNYGRELFGADFLDAIPLTSKAGAVEGVAFVLPYTATLTGKRAHRVYLKNMLLAESIDNLLPDWAFFVKAVVNADRLRPTAARESFYEDQTLSDTRDELGECLRGYLAGLAETNPGKLDRLLSLHALAIKGLAAEDDEFFKLVIDWLPFETSQGQMPFGDYRKGSDPVVYAETVDQFRQVSRVAQAQGQVIVNAGYTYDAQLLERAGELLDLAVERVDPTELAQTFDDLTLDEQERAGPFMIAAESVLKAFRCEPELKRYAPAELPALYTTSGEGRFYRSLEQSKEVANPLWGGVLDSLGKQGPQTASLSNICFNYDNPLVRRLTTVRDRAVLHRSIQMLYLQSLLLGHHPLSSKEMVLLNEGLLALIEWGIGLQG